jgi:hypothetical protein
LNSLAVSIREEGTKVSGNGVGVGVGVGVAVGVGVGVGVEGTVGDGDAEGSGPGSFGPGHAVRKNAKVAAAQTPIPDDRGESVRMDVAIWQSTR